MPDDPSVSSGPCLEAEVLAAYIEDNLPPDQRTAVEAHLAVCEDCSAVLTEVSRTMGELHEGVDIDGIPFGLAKSTEPTSLLRAVFGRHRGWTIAIGLPIAATVILLLASRRC
jgi:hypothetical protein